jgi:hypothetical protein
MRPIITLTTDFGTTDGYVGEVKGVLLSHLPDAWDPRAPRWLSRATDDFSSVRTTACFRRRCSFPVHALLR